MHPQLRRDGGLLRFGLAVIAFSFGGVLSARGADLVAIDFNGNYWDVNKATGAASNPRATGVLLPIDIAVSPSGQLFTAEANIGTGSRVFRLNPSTGASTLVGPTGLSNLIEGGLAFSPAGTLFGAYSLTPNDALVTLNTTTGAGTVVGPITGSDDVSALAFGPGGTLYAIDSSRNTGSIGKLYTLNPATGAILTTTNLSQSFAVGALVGAAIDPDTGVFYVASDGPDQLYTLNPATGVLTTVGPLSPLLDVSGLAFIPEPAAIGMLTLVGMMMLRRSRA